MIASWRGLAAAAAIAVVVLAIVAVDRARAPGVVDHALVPGFDPDRVTELVWQRPGQPALHVVRAGGWRIATQPPVPVDPGAISDVLAALRGARWHRRGEPVPAATTLTIATGSTRRVLGLGAPDAGTDQLWIADGEHGVLVDRWVVRALGRDRLGLQVRTPLADVARAHTIVVARAAGDGGGQVDLRIEGTPRRLVRPVALVLAADAARELEHALRDVTVVRIPDAPVPAHGLAISTTAGGADRAASSVSTVTLGGSCPGAPWLVAMSGTAGDGCVEPAAVAAIERAAARLHQPPDMIVERRLLPFEPAHIVLIDGVTLDLAAPRVGDRPADPARVAEVLAALMAPAEVAPLPATPAPHHLVATDRAGQAITFDVFAERVVARHGEPIALRPGPGAWTLLVQPSRALIDLALWLEEPTTITTLRIDDVAYDRGAEIGAWVRRPAGMADAAALEALVGLLAAPRALGFVDGPVAMAHRLTVVVTPPAGAPVEHVLELGAPRATGCPARVAGEQLLLPAAVCARVARLAK